MCFFNFYCSFFFKLHYKIADLHITHNIHVVHDTHQQDGHIAIAKITHDIHIHVRHVVQGAHAAHDTHALQVGHVIHGAQYVHAL